MNKKIVVGIILSLLLMLVILTGCGNENKEKSNSVNNSEETNTSEQKDNQEPAEINFDTSMYDEVKICSNNKTVLARKDRYYIYLDLDGNRINDKEYWAMDNTLAAAEFVNGNVIIENEKLEKGLLNENGDEIIECQYRYMRYDEDEGLYLVDKENSFPKDGKAYYINEKNEKIKDW